VSGFAGTDTIPGVLEAAAAAFGPKAAYVDPGRSLSFADLRDRVASVAAGYASLGVRPGDRVCVWAPNSIDWVVAALAVSWAGGTLVPINTRYTAHEALDIVERTHAGLVVVARGFLGRDHAAELADAGWSGRCADVTDLPTSDVPLPTPSTSPDDVADILFTSGTTGRPKGVMSAHRQTVGAARAWGELGGVTSEDRYLVINPFFHSFGYKVGIVTGLLTGATLFPLATFDAEATLRLIEQERITVLPGAPTIFQSLLSAAGRAERDLGSLRLAVTGAAVVPVVLIERMRQPAPEGLGIDTVVTAFGMTEAVVATMCRAGDSAEVVATTCGRAVPGMEARISTGSITGPGPNTGEGELLLRGDYVMLGYLDDPEATAEAIDADGWLHTGDVGTLDEHGNLRITDRLKDMYICGGFNVYPAEVEQVLMRLEGVQDVAVVGVPDERLGEVGRAFVVGTASEAAILAHAREHLANFKIPRSVAYVDVLPRNPSGKVLKNELRSPA